MQNFKNLRMYEEAKELALEIYKVTRAFPKQEIFGITQQLRRAVTSVGANIAEGAGRKTRPDFKRFLYNSVGSLNEISYFLEISKNLDYLSELDFDKLTDRLDKISRMIYLFMKKL